MSSLGAYNFIHGLLTDNLFTEKSKLSPTEAATQR